MLVMPVGHPWLAQPSLPSPLLGPRAAAPSRPAEPREATESLGMLPSLQVRSTFPESRWWSVKRCFKASLSTRLTLQGSASSGMLLGRVNTGDSGCGAPEPQEGDTPSRAWFDALHLPG